MNTVRKAAADYRQHVAAMQAAAPAPADYSDEITLDDLEAIKKSVEDEVASGDWVVIDGPAW